MSLAQNEQRGNAGAARILHVVPSASTLHGPVAGGPMEYVLRVSQALRDLGHDAQILSADPPGAPWLAEIAASGVAVTAVGPGRGAKYAYAPALTAAIRRMAPEFDAVIVHGLWTYASVAAWRALRGSATPYYVFVHGGADPWFRKLKPIKHHLKQLYWRLLQARVLRASGGAIYTHIEERDRARDVFAGPDFRRLVVTLGSPAPPSPDAAQRDAFLRLAPSLGDRRYLLFLGRIHPMKGCDLLIDAFARFAAAAPDLDLVVAGPDQLGWRAELEARAAARNVAERVHWTGPVAGAAKWGALHGAEGFFLPSHMESFGIAVVEALSCGLPVLITREVAIWREVEDAGAGIVEADDPAGAARLLERFLALGPGARDEMGASARRLFASQFRMDVAAQALADLAQRCGPGSEKRRHG